jgi:hypothetical protein
MIKMFFNLFEAVKAKINTPKEEIVLVYTLGKVATTTVHQTLVNYNEKKIDVHHVHFLSKNWLKKILPASHPSIHHNIALGNSILNHIAQNPEKRVKIITLTREPIARDISDILQNWEQRYEGRGINEVDTDEIFNNFKKNNDFSYTTTWFDSEFLEYTGFDIYSVPFDTEKGYSIYNTQKFDILVIQSEKLSQCFQEAFDRFLGIKINELSVSNESDDKIGADKIQSLKQRLRYTKEELDRIYTLKYITHFYAKEEIENFYRKWMV